MAAANRRDKGPLAQPELWQLLADPERPVQVQVDVLLNLVHDHVVVRSFPAERNVGELAGVVAVDQLDLGSEVGAVVTGETFHEVQDQVQDRGRPLEVITSPLWTIIWLAVTWTVG